MGGIKGASTDCFSSFLPVIYTSSIPTLDFCSRDTRCPRMFVTSSAPPRPKTGVRRSRAITSCHACRAHRTKCDRNHPVCGRCSKKDAVCIWAGNTSKFSSASQRAHRRHSPEHDGAGGSQLQDDILMETRSGDPATLAFDHDLNVESAEGYSQGLRPGYLALQSGGRSRYVHNNFWANVGNKVI